MSIKSQSQRQQENGSAGYAAFPCIRDFLIHHARNTPDRDAILAPERPSLTYAALASSANDAARCLRNFGIRRSDRVAAVLRGGAEASAAMISIAAAAVCVPFNPGFTASELRLCFSELQIAGLVTHSDMKSAARDTAQELGIPIIDDLAHVPAKWTPVRRQEPAPTKESRACSDSEGAEPALGPQTSQVGTMWSEGQCGIDEELSSGADDAFILLTSGSTSRPKMVPLTHAAVCLSAHNVAATLRLGPEDRLLNVLPLFHGHGLISGLVTALAAGSSAVCPAGFDAAAFFRWLTEFRPTWYTAVPVIHRAVLSAGRREHATRRSSLRLIRSASSTLPPDVVGGLEAMFGVPVIDTYGMTEATTQIAANPLELRKTGSVGRAAGPEIAILDPQGREAPTGKSGEIALRGPTITRAYINNPAATAAAFQDGWFRTGDLGYLDEQGYLFIVGRIKDIIDRGGQKVAPAEVELVLLSHPGVVEAVVFPVPHPRLGAEVAAALVLREDTQVSADQIRDFARERLAEFKVPRLIYIMPEIPKGPAGKIKRDALVAALSKTTPAEGMKRNDDLRAPRSDLENRLADCWMDLLELSEIGIDENVFTLGADSITVIQMLSRLRDGFGLCFSFKDILNAPTVAALSARIEASQQRAVAASPSLSDARTDIVREGGRTPPLSILQEHALRIEREMPGLPQFNLPCAYQLKGPLNIPALERSLLEIVRRHESLRTGFAWLNKKAVAVIRPAADVNLPLAVEDLAASTPSGRDRPKAILLKRAELLAEQEALTPFELDRPPLLRARLLRLGGEDHVLLLTLHDLVVDQWSMEIFIEEISHLYAAIAAGRPAQLPEAELHFSDFVRWQHRWSASEAAERQFASWKERLRDASPPFRTRADRAGVLPTARTTTQPLRISNDLAGRLNALSHSQGVTLFMTLLAGFKTLLFARGGRNDICVATSMANRSQPRAERIIGPLGNTALIRTQLDADLSFEDALGRVRDSVLETYAIQDLPFHILAARLAEEEGLDPASLMLVSFVLQNAHRRALQLPGVVVRSFGHSAGEQPAAIDRTWLRMTLKETESGIVGTCSCKNELFKPDALHPWAESYEAILAKAAADPKISLGRLVNA